MSDAEALPERVRRLEEDNQSLRAHVALLEELRSRLDGLPGADAMTKREIIANDAKLFAKVFSAPLKLMVGIAFLVGTMIVGLIIYTATVERQREYGVIKAIGAKNHFLYQITFTFVFINYFIRNYRKASCVIESFYFFMKSIELTIQF